MIINSFFNFFIVGILVGVGITTVGSSLLLFTNFKKFGFEMYVIGTFFTSFATLSFCVTFVMTKIVNLLFKQIYKYKLQNKLENSKC